MSALKSQRAIWRAMPSSIYVSPAPLKSSTIANRLTGNTRLPARPASSAGPPNGSSSLMKIWACQAAEPRPAPALPGPLPRGGSAGVAAARVGLVLGLEVSRLARNNAEWYRLIDLAGLTDTLIGDGDGLYHPAVFNDRLLMGLKDTMSEAELHILRARLNGGIRNKAARGELRRGLPVGFVWGEEDGEVCFHPDEAVCTAIRQVFAQFAETGSARRVWLWFRSEGLKFPLRMHQGGEVRLVRASYTAIHQVLSHPLL